MNLEVTGVETIEITDPRRLCQPQPQVGSIGVQIGGNPVNIPVNPSPSMPSFPPTGFPAQPNILPSKWYRGLPPASDPKKWQQGWQSKMSPDEQQAAFEHGYTAITQ